jgi:hypothetical protein
MVAGGDDEDERILYRGDSLAELDQTILDANDEVIYNADKYFELIGPYRNHTFYSYQDFLSLDI